MSSRVTVARSNRRPRATGTLARARVAPQPYLSRIHPREFPTHRARRVLSLSFARSLWYASARVRAAMSAGLEARKTLGAPTLKGLDWGLSPDVLAFVYSE